MIESTSLKVCHNRRISRPGGKTSVDWFYGFKLHLVVNELGELLNVTLTPGNIDDAHQPVPELLKNLFGKVFAARAYVSQTLAEHLFKAYGLEFFAKPKRNMKNRLMRLTEQLLSCQRSTIETIIDRPAEKD